MVEFRSGSGFIRKNSSLGIQENMKNRDQPAGQFSLKLKEFLYLRSPVKAGLQKWPSPKSLMHHIVD
jgi:hypothetical protein